MRRVAHTILLLTTSALLLNAADRPDVGSPAPPVSFSGWVTGQPEGSDPFAGKTVLLEFWATWCLPCVASIPHVNRLLATFEERGLAGISITDENRSTVERFLKARAMRSSVVLDESGETHLAYGVDAIPHAFLIDTAGTIRWHGHPVELNEENLRKYFETGEAPPTIDF